MSHSNERMMALAIRKSLLKETNISNYSSGKEGNSSWASLSNQRAVYMNDGDEFQIQLFNPERFTVGCLIYINGRLMSQRNIVLRPGERIWLDRHIDTPEKLKFSTYEVGKSKAVQEAIKDNGLIQVDFYKEEEVRVSYKPTITYQPDIWYNNHSAGDYILGGEPYTICHYSDDTSLDTCLNASVMGDVQTCFCAADVSNDIKCASAKCASAATTTPSHKMETGRIDKGSHSNQSFKETSVDFEVFPYHSEDIKILPMSQKPVRANDLKKKFCPYCGKKLKDIFKFCPWCGKEL